MGLAAFNLMRKRQQEMQEGAVETQAPVVDFGEYGKMKKQELLDYLKENEVDCSAKNTVDELREMAVKFDESRND